MTDTTAIQEAEALEAGVQVVIYGLPLVMMDVTMRRAVNVPRPVGVAAPVNQFGSMRAFPTAAFKDVVRANVDTLYSSAFLDLSKEPLVLSVPDTHGRYYLLPMFDAWTNVFATPGKRTTGTGAARFLISGPGWRGIVLAGLTQLKSPTNMAWILGRTQTNGPADYDAVHAIQDGYTLVPLSAYGKPHTPLVATLDPSVDMKTPPVEQLQRMSAPEYFTALARLLTANPPPASDAPMLATLARIGVVPGQPFDLAKLDPITARGLNGSVTAGLRRIQADARQVGKAVNGWRIPSPLLGNFGDSYGVRAAIALIAFGANLPTDAIYPTAFTDGDGNGLSGANRYTLHFDNGREPPVRAFWSITMYSPESFFVENPIHRYAVSSWMPLKPNADGSLDIYIQHAPPDGERGMNWLPAPLGGFDVTLRMYWPTEMAPSIIDGSWVPPPITRVH